MEWGAGVGWTEPCRIRDIRILEARIDTGTEPCRIREIQLLGARIDTGTEPCRSREIQLLGARIDKGTEPPRILEARIDTGTYSRNPDVLKAGPQVSQTMF